MMRLTSLTVVFRGTVVLLFASWGLPASAVELLVFDQNTDHHFAKTAAAGIDSTPTIATASTFNSLLTSQPWSAVFIDCPSDIPATGWQPTINFIQNGGKVIMSFWDWDNSDALGNPALLPAFGLTSTSSFSVDGRT